MIGLGALESNFFVDFVYPCAGTSANKATDDAANRI